MRNFPLAYSYIRMSTDEQIKGDSLRRQLALSEKYARDHGLTLVTDEVYHDLGVSAFRGQNAKEGALASFIKAARDKKIPEGSTLIVESLDRISRSHAFDAMTLLGQIVAAGIRIVTLHPQYLVYDANADGPTMMMALMSMITANEESRKKSLRVREAWGNKRDNATNKPLTRMCPLWLELLPDCSRFSIIAGRDLIVKRIFDECIEGIGAVVIANRLHREGIPTWGKNKRAAVRWTESYVKKILSNRAVLGEYVPNSVENGIRKPLDTVANYYPAIISEDTFEAARAARSTRSKTGGPSVRNKVSNLFTGVTVCGYCGGSMRFKNPGLGAPPYLICATASRGDGCTSRIVPYQSLELSFLKVAKEVGFRTLLVANNNAANQDDARQQIAILVRLKAQKETAARGLLETVEDPVIHRPILERAKTLMKEANNAELEIKRLSSELRTLEDLDAAALIYDEEFDSAVDQMNGLMGDERFEIRSSLRQRTANTIRKLLIYSSFSSIDDAGHARRLEKMQASLREWGAELELSEKIIARHAEQYELGKKELARNWMYYVQFTSGRHVVVSLNRDTPNIHELRWDTELSVFFDNEEPIISRLGWNAVPVSGVKKKRKPRGIARIRRGSLAIH